MRFDLLAPVPQIADGWRHASILARAQEAGRIDVQVHDLRDWSTDKHRTLDDYPYGGGAGMVLFAEPYFRAVEELAAQHPAEPEVILLSPQGEPFHQGLARQLSRAPGLILLCGRYEGVDDRVRQHLATREVSLGDYVLTGGELAAMAVVDAVARLLPGVLGDEASRAEESFTEPLLEYPHFTRPAQFRGWPVPEVLLAGHHERVRLWRRAESLRRTLARRPELLCPRRLSPEDRRLLLRVV